MWLNLQIFRIKIVILIFYFTSAGINSKKEKKQKSKMACPKTGLWSVELCWNGGRLMEIDSLHYTMEEANEVARHYFDQFDKEWMDNIDIKDVQGKPYEGFACIDCGARSLMVYVSEQIFATAYLKMKDLKDILRMKTGMTKFPRKKDDLIQMIEELLEKENAEKGKLKEKDSNAVEDSNVEKEKSKDLPKQDDKDLKRSISETDKENKEVLSKKIKNKD